MDTSRYTGLHFFHTKHTDLLKQAREQFPNVQDEHIRVLCPDLETVQAYRGIGTPIMQSHWSVASDPRPSRPLFIFPDTTLMDIRRVMEAVAEEERRVLPDWIEVKLDGTLILMTY